MDWRKLRVSEQNLNILILVADSMEMATNGLFYIRSVID